MGRPKKTEEEKKATAKEKDAKKAPAKKKPKAVSNPSYKRSKRGATSN
jgi:hypothetical protein|tara:strand:+ start:160 stop:303 length:144 start_codon:yes stop_codon:yes gene_type:complete